jgi:hypothetical protein
MNNIMKAAANYVEMGWSVIPLRPGSKIPLIDWKDFQHRLPSLEELRTWFQNSSMNNLGIVTGKLSNLSVIDADELKNLHPQTSSSISVITKRGKHLYFKYGGERNSASEIAESIDVRGEGGFVVAPPSVIDGHLYRFVNPVLRPDNLPQFPVGLIPSKEDKTSGIKPSLKPRLKGRIHEVLSQLKEGNRDHTFTSVIGLMHRDGYTASDINVLLAPYAETSGFGVLELEKKIIYLTNTYSNRRIDSEKEVENIESFLSDIQPVTWLCNPIIAKGSLGFVAGLPETQKTWLMMDLAIEMSRRDREGSWLNKFPVSHGRVLFIDQERFKGETQRRLKSMLAEKNIKADDLELYVQSGTTTRINLDESYEAFKRKVERIQPDLIIVDSFATFSTVEENSRREVQTVLERIKQIRQEYGCAVLFIDHENKSVFDPNDNSMPNAFKMVGSVGKPAAAETVLTVRKNKENCAVVYHTKSTLASTVEPFTIEVRDTDKGVQVRAI